tara:strand:+ start:392 stop:523 length:132 start_codon:yes stop_codon:yes gene_type:complete
MLIEEALKDLREFCKKFQVDSGFSNAEIKDLLSEIAILWETDK